MRDPRFGLPADVTWFERALDPASRSQKKHFATLAGAVSFTMEQLPAKYRGSAMILIDGPSIHIEEIEALYVRHVADDDE